jgi:hypothetical protein
VSPAAHESAADARCEIGAALARHPASAGPTVFCQASVKHLRIFLTGNQIADFAAKILRQGGTRRRGNKLLVGMTPQIPSRKSTRCQFRFSVTGRHQQHQPVDLVTDNALELLGDLMVNSGSLIARKGEFSERDQARRRHSPFAFRL